MVNHPDYATARWKRCRDVVTGSDAVKSAGEAYLPKMSGQTREEYDAYRVRALFFPAASRTVDALTGLVFRQAPVVTVPPAMDPYLLDMTMDGRSLGDLLSMVVADVIVVGRAGVLVDYADTRPYLAYYPAEAIVNWRTGRVDGGTALTMVVLRESVTVPGTNEFTATRQDRYRVLDLADNAYRVRMFERGRVPGSEWSVTSETYPLADGQPMRRIPFVFFGPRHCGPDVQKSPLIDLADVNLSHYRTMADLENGAHWVGVPTPVFVGLMDPTAEVKLGSTTGISLAVGGDAKYLEFSGAGLSALEARAKSKEEMMSVLGARMLAADKRQVEAAETAAIHRAGESSVLAALANAVSVGATRALSIMRDWAGIVGDVSIRLNTDYLPARMDAQTLTATVAAWQSGAISKRDLFAALQAGEVVAPTRTYEAMEDDLGAEGPPLGA